MKRSLTILITFFLTITYLKAQVSISGKVKDNRGKPIIGASITLKDTYDGATSDSLGNFKFTTTEKGNFLISITSLGYFSFEQNVHIDKLPIVYNVSLKEQLDELKAVTVTAGAFAAGDSKRSAVLSSLDVATTGGANADITAALKTLPGAQQVGEQEGLFVRGGAGYETKQFIDGTLVNNPYYTSVPDISTRGRFSPFLFKGTVFSTGGYSAQYGEALSSALILESIDLPEKSAANAAISPLFLGAGLQELSKNKQSSWGVNYGYTNLVAYFSIVKQTPDYFKMPEFHNGDANFRIKTKHGGIIKYYTTFSYSKLGLRRPDIDSLDLKDAFGLTNTNWYNNLSYRENLGRGWKMNLGAGYSYNKDDISQQLQDQNNQPVILQGKPWYYTKSYAVVNNQQLTQLKAVFDKKLGGISHFRFGAEDWYAVNKSTYNDTLRKLTDNLVSAFAETDIYVTNNLAANIGARFEYSSLINKSNLAPRVSLAYKVGKGAQVSAAYGVFYQKAENQQLFFTNSLGYTRATHYIVNYQKMVAERILRVEAYYKKYDALVKTIPVNYYYAYYNNNGSGYAKGIELFWRDKKTFKNFDYWVSYSYLDTKRNYLNFPGEMTPNFAANHTASLVTKRFFTSIKTGFNFTYSFATGRPYYNLMYNSGNNKYVMADHGTTKNYNSLGFSMNYVPSVGKPNAKTFIVLVASITNVLGYNAVYGYNYSYNGLNKEPVIPPAKRFYFVGVFLSWGVDRTQDAINNNL
ncbi:TonB-dependent receptor [Danxiaibacter flavus]|uniref:TonB-dependent receptor n=1 Tax=Danxiaibacter flavus TaxID=3049108 RepID=A0ABV3ZFD7_9BACT|nr:TonB-dependent receptor [Chitinophagaceae bacterium DXS]